MTQRLPTLTEVKSWWAPTDHSQYLKYYLLHRWVYGEPAQEALSKTRHAFLLYPNFCGNPRHTLRGVL